jgi:hypothetical protein
MDTDSLYMKRIAALKNQPNTVRGRSIVWYSKLEKKPMTRIFILAALTVFILAHTLAFCILLKDVATRVSRSFFNLFARIRISQPSM